MTAQTLADDASALWKRDEQKERIAALSEENAALGRRVAELEKLAFAPEAQLVTDNARLEESAAMLRESHEAYMAEKNRAAALRAALERLYKEVSGIVSYAGLALNEAIGNTNVAVLKHQLAEARAALTQPGGEVAK